MKLKWKIDIYFQPKYTNYYKQTFKKKKKPNRSISIDFHKNSQSAPVDLPQFFVSIGVELSADPIPCYARWFHSENGPKIMIDHGIRSIWIVLKLFIKSKIVPEFLVFQLLVVWPLISIDFVLQSHDFSLAQPRWLLSQRFQWIRRLFSEIPAILSLNIN